MHVRACLAWVPLLIVLGTWPVADVPQGRTRNYYPGEHWGSPLAPEELGFSPGRLKNAEKSWRSLKSSAFMVVVSGALLADWGDTGKVMAAASVRKSFLSALYGIQVHEGRIDLGRTMAELGIDDTEPGLSTAEKQAKVTDLLRARSGIYHAALAEDPEMKAVKPPRWSHEPGTFWSYNNWDFNALGTIFRQETGRDIYREFKERIADPIQMEDYSLRLNRYQPSTSPESRHAPYPFHMSARDMARFGLLYLQKGQWNGKQVVPRAWVEESTRAYSKAMMTDGTDAGGYGYMWWVADHGKHFPDVALPDGSYSARGYRGHYILVIPDYEMVIVHRPARGAMVTGAEFGALVNQVLGARYRDWTPERAPESPSVAGPG